MHKILCLDYDNTIFDHSSRQIPDSTIEALDKVRGRLKIVLASGRHFNEAINKPILDIIKPDAIIHANGCVVEADGKLLYETYLDNALVEDLIHFALEHHLILGGVYESCWYNTYPEKLRQRWNAKGNTFFPEVKEISGLFGKKIYALFLDDTVEAARLLADNFPAVRTPIMSEKYGGADVIPHHVSKASGIQVLLNYWGMTFQDVIAIGDSMNDYEMIQQASIGIAMGNSVSPLKEIADYVTTHVNKDGIKNALQFFRLI
ncbi:MAG TPA: HAD family phosphatase [Clostridiales bacterium]|nr:HAD family phosphatase [Clostridiales bacterium]